ncbi:MAG: ATP-binding protein [Candidatus Enterenecus sp.]
MKIKKMTATFGALDRATLTPGEGLTVITAPNEGGKSTWAGFLKAMLYGVDTRDRDKTGYLADKNRYQPWSGAPMSGELELEWQGRDITLRRASSRSGPFQSFEAVYTASGDPVPGLTGANAGQTILGAGKDVFVRSALVGQNDAAVTAAPELERRIAALATSGQEDVSAAATQRTLKDWRNRRRSNRANGLIPELEEELAQVNATLRDISLARARREEAQRHLAELSRERTELEAEAEIHRRLAVKALNRRYGEAKLNLERAQAELAALPEPDPALAGLTAAQARQRAADLRAQAEEARQQREQSVRRAVLLRRRARYKTAGLVLVPLLGIGGLAMVVGGFVSELYPLAFSGIGVMFAAVIAMMVAAQGMGSIDRTLTRMAAQEQTEEPVPVPDAEGYADWLAQKDALEREVRHCQERLDDLYAQGGREYDTLEFLRQPVRSAAETAARLRAVEGEAARWQSQLDQATGALRADPLALEARREELTAQLARRTEELGALTLALDALDAANAALRERFSPTLNREAAAIFSRLTGGKYDQLTLSRDFSALAGGSNTAHSALYLSAGTVDQLYLAVRLALCRLTLPGAPILLDDALCAFDDQRMELALDCLRDMAGERQILLFTCHSREARWADGHDVPVIRL